MIRSFFLLSLSAAIPAAAQIPAFPGAEGYGAYAKGGRGGDVYHVTNLNPSGAGSFAEGISTVPSAGRTIVFDVSGYIRFPSGSNGTRMTSSKVTIAGQTAPGDGIGFYNNFFRISGDDVIIRHLRFRHGKYGSGGDCIDLDSGCLNAILDHVSMQFSTDENMSSFGSPPENITLQYSLNAWGLESHSCGGLWDQNHASSHHNLWAHNHTRNPKARPNGLLEWVNNVTYDWDIGFIMGDTTSVQNYKSNVINNYFLCPPGNTHSKALVKGTVATNGQPNYTVFLSGNLSDYDGDGVLNGTDKGYSIVEGTPYTTAEGPAAAGSLRYFQPATAIAGSAAGIATDAPLVAYKKVVSNAGALRLDANYQGPIRDEVDTILLNKLTTQTHFHVTRESDTGASAAGFGVLNSTAAPVDTDRDGMPDYYETALGWNAAAQDHNTLLASSGGLLTGTTFFPVGTVSGYTRLEEYLQFLAIPHGTVPKNISGTPTAIQVDLRKFTSGFATSPSFNVTAVSNGTAERYLADGVTVSATGPIVKFTPSLNQVGRARFDFTVTDAAGSVWTQTFGILISQSGLPRDLTWKGDGNANVWDTAAVNWLRDGAVTAFSAGDRVTFDGTGSLTPAVNVIGTVAPTTVDVNTSGNYTFGGTGAIASSGALTKRGTGTLTIANGGPNGFSAATLDGGAITLGNAAAIASGLGTGQLAMNNGTLNFYDPGAGGPFTATLPNPLAINGSVTLNAGARCGTSGALSGDGTLNLHIPYIRTDWGGNPAAFTGTLNVLTDAGGCEFRINNGGSGGITDYGNSRIWLADKVNAYFLPNPPSSGDKTQTVQVGELATSGTGAGVLLGGASGAADRTVNWKVGALNTSTTFGGSIVNRTGPAALTKTGTGNLTLTGASAATGPTAVQAGSLTVNGSLGVTATAVASGATLRGSGSIGGAITTVAGARIAPGSSEESPGTLTAAGGLSATSTDFTMQLSSSPSGANDRISVTGGTGFVGGTNNFNIAFTDGLLGAGNYKLIECAAGIPMNIGSGMVMNLAAGIPGNTRQTFSLNRTASGTAGGYIQLTVTGNAADLVWSGSLNGATWDLNATSNFTGATPGNFYNLDAVTFDDTSPNRTVALAGSLAPRSLLVNTTAGYTFTGTGTLDGTGALVKNGAGALTLAGSAANTFSGGLTLNAGTIVLGNETANANGLGTGVVTMNAGTISMRDDNTTYNDFHADLLVPAGSTARLNADGRVDMFGTLGGAGTLNFYVPWVRTTLFTDWSAFTGTINVITDADGGDFRMGTSYSFPGFPAAALSLSDKVYAYYVGTLSSGAGTTIDLGEVSGTSQSHLRGGATGGRALTYRIGGRNTDATFAGTIDEQNAATLTNIVKIGSGSWTLTGNSAWAGGTTVSEGTLAISGNIASAGAVAVANGATLSLAGGSVATDSVTVAGGGSVAGYGSLLSDLVSGGTLTGRGFSSGTPGTLDVAGSAFFDSGSVTRLRGGKSSDFVSVAGDLSLAGTIQVNLAAGTGFGRYPLFTYGGNLQIDNITLTGISGDITAKLSSSVAGQVSLVIDDSDEDGLPDSWEKSNFGNLAQGPDDDPDGDGQSNAMEYMTGTLPNNGSSLFAATMMPLAGNQFNITWPSVPGISYAIETSPDLAGTWTELISMPAAASPAITTSYQLSPAGGRKFYRVGIKP